MSTLPGVFVVERWRMDYNHYRPHSLLGVYGPGGTYSESCGCSLLIPVWEINDYPPDYDPISPVAVASNPGVASDTIYISDSISGKILKIEVPKTTVINAIETVWDNMKQDLINEDINGALSYFHPLQIPRYREMFMMLGTDKMKEAALEMQLIVPVSIGNDSARYSIDQNVKGNQVTNLIEFNKVNGVWKISDF